VLWLALYWIGSDTFLLTAPKVPIIYGLLVFCLYTCIILGIWSLLGVRVGLMAKACLFLNSLATLTFLYQHGAFGADSWSGLWAFVPFLLEASMNGLVICFLLYRSRTVLGQTRWLALSFVPFLLSILLSPETHLRHGLDHL
jgi:hypothetical protein